MDVIALALVISTRKKDQHGTMEEVAIEMEYSEAAEIRLTN